MLKKYCSFNFKPWLRHVIKLSVLILMLSMLYLGAVLTWNFSDGDRAGYVQKISKRGWLCKTWEGELAMVSTPGTLTEKFAFTVKDDAVVQKINDTLGKRVSLTYEEHIGIPTTCFGDTSYYVTGVTVLESN